MLSRAFVITVFAMLILIIGITSTLIYYYSKEIRSISDFTHWSCQYDLKTLYERWDIVQKSLEANNIEYFAVGRTLLGAVRHNGIVGWDDKIEISLLRINLLQLLELDIPDMQIIPDPSLKWVLDKETSCFYQILYKGYESRIYIYICEMHNGQIEMMRNLMPNQVFAVNALYPLQRVTFGPSEIYIPSDPIQYMNKVFPLWQVEGVLQKDYGQVKTFPLTKYHKQHPNLNYIDGNISSLKVV
jgi:phosphorylcholine metabolism protein LicD